MCAQINLFLQMNRIGLCFVCRVPTPNWNKMNVYLMPGTHNWACILVEQIRCISAHFPASQFSLQHSRLERPKQWNLSHNRMTFAAGHMQHDIKNIHISLQLILNCALCIRSACKSAFVWESGVEFQHSDDRTRFVLFRSILHIQRSIEVEPLGALVTTCAPGPVICCSLFNQIRHLRSIIWQSKNMNLIVYLHLVDSCGRHRYLMLIAIYADSCARAILILLTIAVYRVRTPTFDMFTSHRITENGNGIFSITIITLFIIWKVIIFGALPLEQRTVALPNWSHNNCCCLKCHLFIKKKITVSLAGHLTLCRYFRIPKINIPSIYPLYS